jgi:2-polyprenyl-3-methyl-5-hydroxy-6-metoxy-1,4-benzoquinol methylase
MTDSSLPSRRDRIAALAYEYAAKPKAHRMLCNLCAHDVFVTVVHRDRYDYPATAQACRRCGLTFLNPVMTAESYGEFYRSVYRPLVSAYHGRLIDAASIQQEQRDYAAILAGLLGRHLCHVRGGRLLDIGGSTGVVAHHFKQEFGMHATVIDPAPMEVEVARRLELETVTGFVETYDPGDSRYQLVLMCQTVDHLLDISTSLRKVRELLSDEGVFFVDIVDFRAAYRRNGSVEEAVKIDHPYYLTEPTMTAYLRRAGFAVKAIDYALDHLHIGFVCTKAEPDREALPAVDDVREAFREIRGIHNRVPTI